MVFLMNVKEFLKPDLKKVVLTILIFLFVPMLYPMGVSCIEMVGAGPCPPYALELNPFFVAYRYVPVSSKTIPVVVLTIVANLIISYFISCIIFDLFYYIKGKQKK